MNRAITWGTEKLNLVRQVITLALILWLISFLDRIYRMLMPNMNVAIRHVYQLGNFDCSFPPR